jgi:hypothetical protein
MTIQHSLDTRVATALAVVAARGIAVRRITGDAVTGMHAAMVRAELAARGPAGMPAHVLVATVGDGYALHCSDEDIAAVVLAACDAAAVETHRNSAVVIARAALSLAA